MIEDLLTTKEVAEILRCTPTYVTLLVKRGHFPGARKLDSQLRTSPLRIPRADVITYQEKQLVSPKSDE
jgi:excisionase family DNA binding protein